MPEETWPSWNVTLPLPSRAPRSTPVCRAPSTLQREAEKSVNRNKCSLSPCTMQQLGPPPRVSFLSSAHMLSWLFNFVIWWFMAHSIQYGDTSHAAYYYKSTYALFKEIYVAYKPSGKPQHSLALLCLNKQQAVPSLTVQVDLQNENRTNCRRISFKYFSVLRRWKDIYFLHSVVKYHTTIVQIVVELKLRNLSNTSKTFEK
jgi:hypothetical protein